LHKRAHMQQTQPQSYTQLHNQLGGRARVACLHNNSLTCSAIHMSRFLPLNMWLGVLLRWRTYTATTPLNSSLSNGMGPLFRGSAWQGPTASHAKDCKQPGGGEDAGGRSEITKKC
jgi:hypothetical protein